MVPPLSVRPGASDRIESNICSIPFIRILSNKEKVIVKNRLKPRIVHTLRMELVPTGVRFFYL